MQQHSVECITCLQYLTRYLNVIDQLWTPWEYDLCNYDVYSSSYLAAQ